MLHQWQKMVTYNTIFVGSHANSTHKEPGPPQQGIQLDLPIEIQWKIHTQ